MIRKRKTKTYNIILAMALLVALVLPSFALADACSLRTHTQAEWGTSSNGANAAAYRTKHFPLDFPQGVVIGDILTNGARFTSSSAVQLYLPATGSAGVLVGNGTNPVNTTSGALGGEALSLALNIGFDLANESFAVASTPLRDTYVTTGPCMGKTTSWVLAQANSALTGNVASLSLAELQSCAALINTNASLLSCTAVTPPTNVPENVSVNETNVTAVIPTNVTNTTVEEIPTNGSGNATNTTQEETVPTPVGSLRIAPWYPKGSHYVFICDVPTPASGRYDWRFGDGEKLLGIRNRDVYHIFKRSGTYDVTCGAANATSPVYRTVVIG